MAPTGDRQGVCLQLTLDCRRGWWEPLRVDGSPQAQTFHSSLASALPPLPRDSRKEITPWRLERLYGRRNGRRQFLRPHLFPPWQEVSFSPQSGAPSGWSRKLVSSPDHPWNTRPAFAQMWEGQGPPPPWPLKADGQAASEEGVSTAASHWAGTHPQGTTGASAGVG